MNKVHFETTKEKLGSDFSVEKIPLPYIKFEICAVLKFRSGEVKFVFYYYYL